MQHRKKASAYEDVKAHLDAIPSGMIAKVSVRELKNAMQGQGSLSTFQKYLERYKQEQLLQPGLPGMLATFEARLDVIHGVTKDLIAEMRSELERQLAGQTPNAQSQFVETRTHAAELGEHADERLPAEQGDPMGDIGWPDPLTNLTIEGVAEYDAQMAAIVQGSEARFIKSSDDGANEDCERIGMESPNHTELASVKRPPESNGEIAHEGALTAPRQQATGPTGSGVAPLSNAISSPRSSTSAESNSEIGPSPSRSQDAGSIEASIPQRPNADDPHEGDPAPAGKPQDL